LALGAFFAFSLMPVFTRGAHAPIVTVAAWRAVIVAVVFGVWAAVAEGGIRALRPEPKTLKLGVVYGLALAVASSTFVAGYALTTAANTIFLHNLAPVAAFPLAWWAFREKPSASAMTGALIAVLGVALLSGVSVLQFSKMTNPRFLLGDLAALVSAVGYAAVLVCTRATRREKTPILGTLFVAWCVAALVLVLVALLTDGLAISGTALLWVLGLAVIATNVPFWLLNLSMKELTAGMAAVLSLSEVVFVTLIGLVLWGEYLAPIGWVGAALVLAGLLYPLAVPDDADTPDTAMATLAPETQPRRWARLGLCLVLVNGGAVLALTTGAPVGALLAWAGLVGVLRLGPAPAAALMDGRFGQAMRWGFGGLAAVTLAGLALRSGWDQPGSSGAAAGLALLVLYADRKLAAGESERDRDLRPLASLALALLAAGQAMAVLQHPADRALTAAAAACLALEAWGVLLAAIKNRIPGQQVHLTPEQAPLDALPGRLRSPTRWVPLSLAIIFLGGVVVVPPGHLAVVEQLGRPLPDAAQPGLLVRLPPPLARITLVNVARVQSLVLVGPETPLLCGDQSMIALRAVLEYTVADAHASLFAASDPESELRGLGRSALVAALGRRTQDDVLTTGREALETEIRLQAQAGADRVGLGLHVQAVHLGTVAVPSPVIDAFLDVISAHEEQARLINDAQAYAADVLPKARGEGLARLDHAAGEAAEMEALAFGQLALFEALLRGGVDAPELTRYRLALERQEAMLQSPRLVVADPAIQVWIGDNPLPPTPGGSR
jgi:regulator of protease activity HflC (stomatin/prohibitin superfamily)/drug/metabolite transporter (DMT)-like permease